MIFWLCVTCICLWRVYVEAQDPTVVPLAKRIVAAVIVALLFAAALSAQEMATAVIIRCYPCGWWDLFCCVG